MDSLMDMRELLHIHIYHDSPASIILIAELFLAAIPMTGLAGKFVAKASGPFVDQLACGWMPRQPAPD